MKNKRTITPDVIGVGELLAKFSEVDSNGQMHNEPIDGLIFRMTRPVAHDDGHVTEVARVSWSELAEPIVQVHITTTLPGRIRAWGLHPQGIGSARGGRSWMGADSFLGQGSQDRGSVHQRPG